MAAIGREMAAIGRDRRVRRPIGARSAPDQRSIGARSAQSAQSAWCYYAAARSPCVYARSSRDIHTTHTPLSLVSGALSTLQAVETPFLSSLVLSHLHIRVGLVGGGGGAAAASTAAASAASAAAASAAAVAAAARAACSAARVGARAHPNAQFPVSRRLAVSCRGFMDVAGRGGPEVEHLGGCSANRRPRTPQKNAADTRTPSPRRHHAPRQSGGGWRGSGCDS